MDIQKASGVYAKLSNNIEKVIKGQQRVIRALLAAFFSGGHVLLEDYPGTGKTTLAKTLAKSIHTDFRRVQFTPDLLPSDILGVSIFNQRDGKFVFHQGPVFTTILLTDEINRASPRTQSALLEAMAEGQVTVDGTRYDLPELFFVIATQNNVESRGTYPLPESQMDRFMLQLSLGYVNRDDEASILLDQGKEHPLTLIDQVADISEIMGVRRLTKTVRISDELRYYMVDIVSATRHAEGVSLGCSPRASLSLMRTAQALALFDGLDFVTPEHIQEMAVPVIAHRILLDPQARFSGVTPESVVLKIIEQIAVPK